MPPIHFAVQSYRHDVLPVSAQRLLNMYSEAQPQGAKSQVAVRGCPGITTFATAGAGPVRGFHLLGGVLYAVSGTALYSITNAAAPVVTNVGSAVTGSGIVSMDDNGTELVVVNGTNGNIYDTSAGFRLITDADFNSANTVAYIDSRFMFDWASTAKFFISDSLDGTAYDPLAFATKESKSNDVLAVVNVKQMAYILGDGPNSEVWAGNGAANFPFQRLPGGTVDRGIIGAHAHTQEDQALFIVGDDRMAYRVGGVQLQRISTHAIEGTWKGYTAVSDCFGLTYTYKGHKFVVFTFPSQEVALGDTASWAYDISTQLWHERLSYDTNGTPLGRWRGNCAIEAYGKVLIGDAFSGKIGYLDPTVHTEFDDPMYASATSSPYHAGDRPLFHSDLTVDMETGVGIDSGQGSDPQIMLDISDDGGQTFGSNQPWAAMGAQGAYKTWVRWHRLGRTERGGTRVYRVTVSDPVKRTIVGAHSNMKAGL
jgi:hypothetical protein